VFWTGSAPSSSTLRRAVHKLGLAFTLACGLAAGTVSVARNADAPEAIAAVPLATLPAEARQTYERIFSGGPFPYRKDGTVFGNRERLLPKKARGFYREYTVKTPGSSDRGARRIICGGEPPAAPQVCYYTSDHYASFRRIVQ